MLRAVHPMKKMVSHIARSIWSHDFLVRSSLDHILKQPDTQISDSQVVLQLKIIPVTTESISAHGLFSYGLANN